MGGICLSITLLVSIGLIIVPSNAYAEGIVVQSFVLDKTAIIEAVNNSDEDIDSVRIWLGNEINFKSFKTEEGWLGEKNQQGTIIFTSSNPMSNQENL